MSFARISHVFQVISERLPIGFDHNVSDVGFERNVDWLVVWNYFFCSIYWECHHPN